MRQSMSVTKATDELTENLLMTTDVMMSDLRGTVRKPSVQMLSTRDHLKV